MVPFPKAEVIPKRPPQHIRHKSSYCLQNYTRTDVSLITMHLLFVPLFALLASASSDWWYFDAWDGLSCGDAPQNGELVITTEGSGNQVCISLDESQKAYSYSSAFGLDETEVRGFFYEHCAGPSKVLVNDTCTNPDANLPYIRSWKVSTAEVSD